MAEVYKVKTGDAECWEFEYKGEVYGLPIGQSIPLFMLERLERHTVSDLADILRAFVPVEVVSKMTAGEVNQIFEAWKNAITERQGASLGE